MGAPGRCPAGHLSEEQLLLAGRALARLRLPRRPRLLAVALRWLLLHLHGQRVLVPAARAPAQARLVQEGLVLAQLLFRLLGVALGLPRRLARLRDDLRGGGGAGRL